MNSKAEQPRRTMPQWSIYISSYVGAGKKETLQE